VNIFDADGRFLNSSERWPVPHADLSDRNFFKTFKLEADSPPVLIQRVDSRLSKGSTIVVARKVASSDGLFLGMVTRSISPEKFEAFFSAISRPDIALAMLHRDGPLLARYPHFDEIAAKDLFDSPPDIQASADGYATVESQSFVDDKDNLAAEGSLEHYPIYVVATKLRSSVLASWNQQNRTVIMAALLVALVVGTMLIAIVRHLKEQHRRLNIAVIGAICPNKMAPVQGPFSLVVPMTVTLLNDHGALPAILVPTSVHPAVMSVVAVLGSRTTKLMACPIIAAISVYAPIAPNTNAEFLSTGHTWKA
jgi:hypothetical protein